MLKVSIISVAYRQPTQMWTSTNGYYLQGRPSRPTLIDGAVHGAERHWSGQRGLDAANQHSGLAEWKPWRPDRQFRSTQRPESRVTILAEYPVIGVQSSGATGAPALRHAP